MHFGKNGLIGKSQEASTKHQEQSAREKLELVLLNLQADKVVDENYNENDYINVKIENNGMIVNGNIILVDGWQFEIDRSIPQIKGNLGKGTAIQIDIPYIGTSSFTTNIIYAYNENEIELYTYVIDDIEIATISNKEYTKEELEPETTHTVKVIAKYKDGTILESNTITITTEERTYLYKEGEEFKEITGEWVKAVSTYSGTGAKRDTNLYCYSPIHKNVYSTYYFRTANKIDLRKYKKLCFKASVTIHSNGNGGHSAELGVWDGLSYSYYNSMISSIISSNKSIIDKNFNGDIIIDISNLNTDLYIAVGIFNGGANDSISTNIYSVWLEK